VRGDATTFTDTNAKGLAIVGLIEILMRRGKEFGLLFDLGIGAAIFFVQAGLYLVVESFAFTSGEHC
jgi:hypothetical protein